MSTRKNRPRQKLTNPATDPSVPRQEAAADAEVEEEISDEETDPTVGQMYDSPIYMNVIGDRDELGWRCIAGQRVDQCGPTTRNQIEAVVKEALMRGSGDRWNVADFYKNSSDINRGRKMYEEIIHYSDGYFQILPTNECKFHCEYHGFSGVEYGKTYRTRLTKATNTTSASHRCEQCILRASCRQSGQEAWISVDQV